MPCDFFGVGNVFQPISIGSAEVAFPIINNLSIIVLLVSLALAFAILVELISGLGTLLNEPLRPRPKTQPGPSAPGGGPRRPQRPGDRGTDIVVPPIAPINFIGILLYTKATGMALVNYGFAIAVVSFLLLASLPSLTGGLIMLMTDVVFNTTFLAADLGGDVLFWQHLFWVFGHPEVYVLIIPAFAVVSKALNVALGIEVVGPIGMLAGVGCIAGLGLVVWAHHMYTVGMEADARAYFAAATLTIAIPSGLKIMHWIATLTGGG
jgi:heme/copper-type cytochrome/quinol oxidase subunit 1